MNVLYFSPRVCWPLTSGARLRDYHLAHWLATRCSLTYLGLLQEGDPDPEPPAKARFTAYLSMRRDQPYKAMKLVRGLWGPVPVNVLNYWSPQIAAKLAEVLAKGQFDLVQLEGVHLIQYLPVIRSAASGPVIVADWHDIWSQTLERYAELTPSLPKKLAARRTAHLLVDTETGLLTGCDAHTVTSARDREMLCSRVPAADIHVVPNGVDVEFFREAGASSGCWRPEDAEERRSVVFVGAMYFHANIDAVVWFVRKVWPELHRRHPSSVFTIVGSNPTPEVRSLASESVIVTDTVADVRPYYAQAAAAVVPLRVGSGTRLKILEAMAAGVPVVSTGLGAEGLAVEDGVNILLADTAGQMVAALDGLLSQPASRCCLAGAGRALVARLYNWPILGETLHRIHCKTLDRVKGRRES